MFTRTIHHGYHSETETLIKWAVLLTLAGALTCMLAREAGGAPPAPGPPGATRIPVQKPDAPPYPIAWPEPQEEVADWERATTLWKIIDLHNGENHEEADALWETVTLPSGKTHWKLIGRGYAAFAMQDCDRALELLEEARAMAPHHPVPHYFKGLVHLRQAATAKVYHDDAGPDVDHLVAAVPNPAKLHRAAMAELLKALELAPAPDALEPLLTVAWVAPSIHSLDMPLAVPTGIDLMEAINANDLQADAHWRLGAIYLDANNTEDAERHWDEAADLGRDLRGEYRLLGKHYAARGDHLGATRAHTKSIRFGGPYRVPASDAAASFLRALMSP